MNLLGLIRNNSRLAVRLNNQFRNMHQENQLKVSSPTRSILYIPASDEKKVSKIFSLNADCVVLDCEDGVALTRKKEARENIRKLFDSEQRVQNDADGKFSVRINGPCTQLANDDLKVIFTASSASRLPRRIFVPKTDTPDQVKWLYESLNAQLKNYPDFESLNLFFYMESALSLINLNEIIKTGLNLSSEKYANRFNLEGFVFGSDDFCADIGASRTKDSSELIYARQKVVAYCKAYKLKVIDMVYIDFKDLEGLRVQSEQGARMGFNGKQIIHPGQIEVTQQAYTPHQDKIEWAIGLIQAFYEHQKSGAGAFTYKGQMIDKPSLLQAQNIIAIANRIKKPSS